MSVELQWGDPPPPPRRGRPPGMTREQDVPWARVGEALRSWPGQWAWVATSPNNDSARVAAGQMRRGERRAMGPGPWEVVVRTVDGAHRIYARYTGGAA